MKRREGVSAWGVVGAAVAAMSLSFAAGVVSAEDAEDTPTVPTSVGFSGWITDADGVPLTDVIDVNVGVYPSETGGESLDTIAVPETQVKEGRFSLTLQTNNPDTWDGSIRWIEVSVNGKVLEPRTAIVSAPYASRAGVAYRLTSAGKDKLLEGFTSRLDEIDNLSGPLETKADTLEEEFAVLEERFSNVRAQGDDVFFEGVNVYIRDGSGVTLPTDDLDFEYAYQVTLNDEGGSGLGNLVIGYDEAIPSGGGDRDYRTGQHNLVIGPGHQYTSSAAIVAGYNNEASSHSTATLGGWRNTAKAPGSVHIGGTENVAEDEGSVALGGKKNHLIDSSLVDGSTVAIGGEDNEVSGNSAVIVGGEDNSTSSSHTVIAGGDDNDIASGGKRSVIIGGERNTIPKYAVESVIIGGKRHNPPGVSNNFVSGAVIVGGTNGEVTANDAVSIGGHEAKVSANRAVQIAGVSQTNGVEDTGQIAE